MNYPKWVSNEKKYDRAIVEFIKEGNKAPTEEQIKKRYISYGGLVLGDASTAIGVPEEILSVGIEGIKLNGLLKIAEHFGVDVKGLKKNEIVEALQKFLDEDKKPEKNDEQTPSELNKVPF